MRAICYYIVGINKAIIEKSNYADKNYSSFSSQIETRGYSKSVLRKM